MSYDLINNNTSKLYNNKFKKQIVISVDKFSSRLQYKKLKKKSKISYNYSFLVFVCTLYLPS